ncbi:acyltransferase [Erwinia sp. 198]|uniref:acyltransferase family protein n=1 Tax=Erwinia sp. 198 TaxID=2022746 RepID=UPI000F67A615|nr:acyltransferase [Erwinia sp. 198]RRZ94519.1 acyltransferase [Erwinia sp. 198]
MDKNENNHWLDLCRAIAILMVLLSHGRGYLIPLWEPFNGFKFGGFLGVELFFALSGFLIGKIIINKSINCKNPLSWIPAFWFRRWARTYPIYIAFLIINVILLSGIRLAPHSHIVSYFTFTQALTAPHPLFFGEAWSLAIEEVFYFTTPLLYLFLFFYFKNSQKTLLFCLIIMVMMPTAYRVYLTTLTSFSFNEIRTISFARLDSIMYGVFFSWAIHFYPVWKDKIISLSKKIAFLFPALAYLAHFSDADINSHPILRVILFNISGLVCSAVVVCGLHANIPEYLNKIIKGIARGSYISYLINLPIIYIMHTYTPSHITKTQGVALWMIYLSSTLLISVFLHEKVEKKILLIRDKIVPR